MNDIQALMDADRTTVWHSFTQMAEYEPFIVESAKGSWLTDIHGDRYFDGVSNLWCNIHGHNHPHLNAAIESQLKKVAHVTSLGMSNPPAIRLAQRLAELTPEGLSHVFFCSDGASAVEVALKMAFQYWHHQHGNTGRTKFAALGHAYHGDTIGSVSVGGIDSFHSRFNPLLFDAIRLPSPGPYRLDPKKIGDKTPVEYLTHEYRKILTDHQHQIAGVIIEPIIQGAAGIIVQPRGLLSELRKITGELGLPLIADEVAVGFGRTGTLFACEQEDISPDIMCVGKGLSGGYLPMSAAITSSDIFDAYLGSHAEGKTLFHGHTYGGNPLGAAVSLASIELFDIENTLEQLIPKIGHFHRRLDELSELDQVGEVRRFGFAAGIEVVANKKTKEPFDWRNRHGKNICNHILDRRVWLRPLGDVIVAMPPYCTTLEEIDLLVEAIHYGIEREFAG